MLADPEREVIRAFGVEHRRGLAFATLSILGIPLGVPTGYRAMARPTSILVDERGAIRWIDQAHDYRLRGDRERVEAALAAAFPAAPERA